MKLTPNECKYIKNKKKIKREKRVRVVDGKVLRVLDVWNIFPFHVLHPLICIRSYDSRDLIKAFQFRPSFLAMSILGDLFEDKIVDLELYSRNSSVIVLQYKMLVLYETNECYFPFLLGFINSLSHHLII